MAVISSHYIGIIVAISLILAMYEFGNHFTEGNAINGVNKTISSQNFTKLREHKAQFEAQQADFKSKLTSFNNGNQDLTNQLANLFGIASSGALLMVGSIIGTIANSIDFVASITVILVDSSFGPVATAMKVIGSLGMTLLTFAILFAVAYIYFKVRV